MRGGGGRKGVMTEANLKTWGLTLTNLQYVQGVVLVSTDHDLAHPL